MKTTRRGMKGRKFGEKDVKWESGVVVTVGKKGEEIGEG